MIDARFSVSRWKTRHAVVVWIGIVLNLIFAIPLLVDPNWLFSLIGVPTVTPFHLGPVLRRAVDYPVSLLRADDPGP